METKLTIFVIIVIIALIARAVLVIMIEDGRSLKDLLGINDVKYLINKIKSFVTKRKSQKSGTITTTKKLEGDKNQSA